MEKLRCKCKRCGHKWTKRQFKDPVACPGCHTVLWNKRRKNLKGAGRPSKDV